MQALKTYLGPRGLGATVRCQKCLRFQRLSEQHQVVLRIEVKLANVGQSGCRFLLRARRVLGRLNVLAIARLNICNAQNSPLHTNLPPELSLFRPMHGEQRKSERGKLANVSLKLRYEVHIRAMANKCFPHAFSFNAYFYALSFAYLYLLGRNLRQRTPIQPQDFPVALRRCSFCRKT